MKRHPELLAILLLLLPFAAGASGDQGLRAGEGFQVRGVYFHVASVSPDGGALFRVTERLEADGAAEHADCYRVGRAYYHVEACPVLQAHFARVGDPAHSRPPAASGGPGTGGSHPIDYLRGSYVEPQSGYDRSYPGVYFGAWIGSSLDRGRFRGRSAFGIHGRHGRGFGHGFVGGPSFRFSFRRW